MINLQSVSGLPLQFDNDNLYLNDIIESQGMSEIMIDNLRGELLNSSLTCPTHFCNQYFKIDQHSLMRQAGLRYDIVVMTSNLAGIEYVKTKGHYNDLVTSHDSLPEILEILYGWATVLLQRPRLKPSKNNHWSSLNDMFEFNRLDDVIVIKLQKGQKLVIPSGWGHVFINTRQTPLVYSIVRNSEDFNIRRFIPEQGAGYYFIRKNARQEIVRNPRYKTVPRFKKGQSKFVLKELAITEKTPIFKQIVRRPERYNWLRNPGLVNWNKIISAYIA
jgi:glucose-6-phosphate isomerase, archaeal